MTEHYVNGHRLNAPEAPGRGVRRRRNETLPRSQSGSTMLGLLGVFISLGVLAVVAVFALGGLSDPLLKSSTSSSSARAQGSGAAAGAGVSSDICAGLTATCVADFNGLFGALQTYEALHDGPPPAGTSWLVHASGAGTVSQPWPSLKDHFIFTWNGKALRVVSSQGSSSSDSVGSAVSATGCYVTAP